MNAASEMEQSDFVWANAKKTADTAVFQHYGDHLKDAEIQVLQGAWDGLTYEKIAEQHNLSFNYLRADLGNKLWQKLSKALNEEVTKHNFKNALERAFQKQQAAPQTNPKITSLEGEQKLSFPEGPVPLESPFYIESEGIETLCYAEIARPAALIRIKAPRLMGKTSLVVRILAQAQGAQTVYLDLNSLERSMVTDLDKLLRWLCWQVGQPLRPDNADLLRQSWDTEILGSNDNCTGYFEEHLLPALSTPLVVALDNVDRLFSYAEVVEDVLGLLRSWHEKGKISPLWKKLRLVLAHSTECYIPLDLNQSPFNAGVPVELIEFNAAQVKTLAQLYGLNWDEAQVQALMGLIGGHPYLTSLALYELGSGHQDLAQFLHEAPTEQGIYRDHLRRHLETLQPGSPLAEAFCTVVTASEPVELSSIQTYQLHSMGLIHQKDNQVMPRCSLYRDYFRRALLLKD